jgi:hypothetical protein
LNIFEDAVKWALGSDNLFATDDYLAYKYNFIKIESDYDSDSSSGFDSAYYSCWCLHCGQIGLMLYGRP